MALVLGVRFGICLWRQALLLVQPSSTIPLHRSRRTFLLEEMILSRVLSKEFSLLPMDPKKEGATIRYDRDYRLIWQITSDRTMWWVGFRPLRSTTVQSGMPTCLSGPKTQSIRASAAN